VLVLVPFVGNDIITSSEKASVQNVVQLTGAGLIVTVAILTVMITPIMIALRAILAVTIRAARPAIVAAAVLATARALGEAIMISMVSGGSLFSPKPIDGLVFLFEPLSTLAATIVNYHDGISAPALGSSLYAFALLLLFSAFV